MATLNTTNIKHASSSSNNIVLAADGSCTFPSTNTGKILQVLQVTKTDTASTGSNSYADISGLTQAITTTGSNKVLVRAIVHFLV